LPESEVVELRGTWVDGISAEVEATRARVDEDFKAMAQSVGQPTTANKGLQDSYRGLAGAKGIASGLAGEQRGLASATQSATAARNTSTSVLNAERSAYAASIQAMQAARGAALSGAAAQNQLAEAYRNRARAMGASMTTGTPGITPTVNPLAAAGTDFLKSAGSAALGFAGVATAAQALSTLASNLQKASSEALSAERAEARLTAALRLQGQASESNIRVLQDQADALERLTGMDDKAIQGAQQLALSIGGKSVPETIRMTTAAVNLAAALDTDVNTAMLAIVKASENGGAALARLGIRFESTGDAARDSVAIIETIEQKLGNNFAENAIGPVARKMAELDSRIEENDEVLGANVLSWQIWAKSVSAAASDAMVAINNFVRAREKANPIDPMQEQRDFYNQKVPKDRPEDMLMSPEQKRQSREAADRFLPAVSDPTDPARRLFGQFLPSGDQNQPKAPVEDRSPKKDNVTKEMQAAWEKSMTESAKRAADATAAELAELEKLNAAMAKSLTVHLKEAIEAGFGYGARFNYDFAKQGRDQDQFGNPVFPDEMPPRRQLQYQEFDYGNSSRIPETDLEQFLADEKKIADAREKAQQQHAALVREWGDFFASSLEETFRRSGEGISILEMALLKLVDSLIQAASDAAGGGSGGWLGGLFSAGASLIGGGGGSDGGVEVPGGLDTASRFQEVTTAPLGRLETNSTDRMLTAARRDHWLQPVGSSTTNNSANSVDQSRNSQITQNITIQGQSTRPARVTPLVAMRPFQSNAYAPNFNPMVMMMDDAVVNGVGPQLAQLQAMGWR
jgi:hypothetical protein